MKLKRGNIVVVRKKQEPADEFALAVVVSSDIENKYMDYIQIVYLTHFCKPTVTHVKIFCGEPMTAWCDQIFTVQKKQIVKTEKSCTDNEMDKLNFALFKSLGLTIDKQAYICRDKTACHGL